MFTDLLRFLQSVVELGWGKSGFLTLSAKVFFFFTTATHLFKIFSWATLHSLF